MMASTCSAIGTTPLVAVSLSRARLDHHRPQLPSVAHAPRSGDDAPQVRRFVLVVRGVEAGGATPYRRGAAEPEFVLAWRWFSTGSVVLAVLAALYNGAALYPIFALVRLLSVASSLLPVAIDPRLRPPMGVAYAFGALSLVLFVVFGLSGAWLAYTALAGLFNWTKVSCKAGVLRIRHHPLPWPGVGGAQAIPTAEIAGVRWVKVTKAIPKGGVTFEVRALLRDRMQVVLVKRMGDAEARFIAQTLEKELGLSDASAPTDTRSSA
jgi:hypothetical protein